MHRVRNAVIMAAGKGERLRPLTGVIPKPLIRVNGVRMIDTVINALKMNGITDITVVTGYLGECFSELKQSFPEIRLISNPYYESCNNISSLYTARELLGETMILDGDLIIREPGILAPEFGCSGYNAIWTDAHTDEWLMKVSDGRVTECSRTGGEQGWVLYSISRWTAEDSERLRRHIELDFADETKRGLYWDDTPMFTHFGEYELGIREMRAEDVAEIDSLEELAAVDSSYQRCLGGVKNG